jgi:hypothetical protein
MERKKALEQLFSAFVETGAEFSVRDGSVIVGSVTFTYREDYIVVSTGPATNFFQYATLSYICSQGDSVCIADTHVGVFGTYKVR